MVAFPKHSQYKYAAIIHVGDFKVIFFIGLIVVLIWLVLIL